MNEKRGDFLRGMAKGLAIVGSAFLGLVLFGLFDVSQWVVAGVAVLTLILLVFGFAKGWFG